MYLKCVIQNIKGNCNVLKLFQVFFFPRASFTETSAELSKDTSNHRMTSDLRLNLLYWDMSKAPLECFMRR